MSRINQRSNLFQRLWNALWNGLTSTNTKRGTHTPGATRQTGVPENTKPQVSAFRSTHPLKGEAPNGTAASPGADPHCGWHDEHEPHIEGFGRCDGSALAVEHSDDPPRVVDVEEACEVMHDAYERAAAGAGWETNPASRKPWSEVPEPNRVTMRAAVAALLEWISATDGQGRPA